MFVDSPQRAACLSRLLPVSRCGTSVRLRERTRRGATARQRKRPVTRNCRAGATTVEMAFVAPFVLFIIFGSVEFSRMMMVKQSLTNAAREGCRHATLVSKRDHSSAETVVRDRLQGVVADALTTDGIRVTISPPFTESPATGTEIVTTVEVDCSDVSWLPATFLAGAKIRGTASMYRE